jgi:hypothetical protein
MLAVPHPLRPVKSYPEVVQLAQRAVNLLHDKSWTPVFQADLHPVSTNPSTLVGELAICPCLNVHDLLFQVGARLESLQHDLPIMPEFRRQFAHRWFNGTSASGQLPNLIYESAKTETKSCQRSAILFFITNRWERINTPESYQSEHMDVLHDSLPGRKRLMWPEESRVVVEPYRLDLVPPQSSHGMRKSFQPMHFQRVRGNIGTPGFSEERLFSIGNREQTHPSISPSLSDVLHDVNVPVRKGWFHVVNILVLVLRRTSHPDPSVLQISFPLHATEASPYLVAMARKSFSGVFYQTSGLGVALNRWCMQRENHGCKT